MVLNVVQCVRSVCNDVGIVDNNPSADMIAKEGRVNKEVQSVPPWRLQFRSRSFEGVSTDLIFKICAKRVSC